MNYKHCINCGAIETNTPFIRISADRRGGRIGMICPDCMRQRAYSWENRAEHGVNTRNRTYSIELETMRPTAKATYELAENGILPSSDCTVDSEFKTPIYHNLKSPVRLTKTIQRLIDGGEMVIDSHCGTHFHVGMPNDEMNVPCFDRHHYAHNNSRIGVTRRFINSLFTPVSDWMIAHPAETVAVFGRNFGHWAQPITMSSDAMTHENWINLQHSYSIEFRLCFFRDAAQYALCMNTCDKIFSALETHFWNGFDSRNTAERKAAAAKTARYIIRILEKAAAQAEALNN